MRFKVLPRGMKSDRARWTLEIGGDYLVVVDAEGETLADWEGQAIVAGVRTPSFFQNRKGYGVVLRGTLIDFSLSDDAKAELQALLDRTYVRLHPDPGGRAVKLGLGKAAGGLLMVAIAVGLTILANMEESSRPVWFMGMVVGAALCVQGLYQASTAGKWRRVAAEVAEGDERRRRKEAERKRQEDATEDDR